MRNNNKKNINLHLHDHEKLISLPYHDQQNGGFELPWKHLIFWFLQNSSQGINKDLKWTNLKSKESEIELPGRSQSWNINSKYKKF